MRRLFRSSSSSGTNSFVSAITLFLSSVVRRLSAEAPACASTVCELLLRVCRAGQRSQQNGDHRPGVVEGLAVVGEVIFRRSSRSVPVLRDVKRSVRESKPLRPAAYLLPVLKGEERCEENVDSGPQVCSGQRVAARPTAVAPLARRGSSAPMLL